MHIATKVYVLALLSLITVLKHCPGNDSDNSTSSGFQPSQAIQDGVNVFDAYFEYYHEYSQAQASNSCSPVDPKCNPCGNGPGAANVACQILNPPPTTAPPNPVDPIQVSIASLIFPSPAKTVLPTYLSEVLKNDLQTILSRVPVSHASQVKSLSLTMTPCSSGDKVLWSGLQINGSVNGQICVSPLIIRAVVIDVAATPATDLFKLLSHYNSPDPFAFNGDSNALIQGLASKTPGEYTPDDIHQNVNALNASVLQVGGVLPTFKNCIDYLIAREVVQVYSDATDENSISSAAAALIMQNAATHLDLSPLSSLLLPAAIASVITSKAANDYQCKTGQRNVPGT